MRLILNESMFKEELPQLLAEAYIKDYRPEESILLIEAYKLLQETGSYYNDNKKGV